MSEPLDNRAETIKLARLLGVEPAEVGFLAKLPSRALREYREAVTARLFEADATMFSRVAAAAKLIPSGLIASIAQRSFGPLLCARAAGAVDTGKALDVLRRLPPEFVADATIEVDPRRVVDLIAAVPKETVVPVARILGDRREFVTMGRFLAFVPDHAIVSAIGVLSDEALLRTAFVLEHKDRLDHAVGLLPADRLPGVIAHASKLGLWPEALDLLDHLSEARRAPIADVVAAQDPEVIFELVAAVSSAGIWDSLLPIVRLMRDESVHRLVAVPAFHDPGVLAEIISCAADSEDGLWRDLAPLVGALPPDVLAVAGRIAGELDAVALERIVHGAAGDPHTVASLVSLIAAMGHDARRRVATVVERAVSDDPSIVETLIEAAARERLWPELAPLLALMPDDTVSVAAHAAATLDEAHFAKVIEDAARTPEAVHELVTLLEHMTPEARERLARILDHIPAATARQLLAVLEQSNHTDTLERLPVAIREAVIRAAQLSQ